MSETYDIYFTGKIVDGFDEASVRENLARIFKANAATVEKLFSGKPQLIKRGVDRKTAVKYRETLAKAGAVPVIRAGAEPRVAPGGDADLPSSSAIPEAAPSDQPDSAATQPAAGTLAERIASIAGEAGADMVDSAAQAAAAAGPAAASFDASLSLAPVGSEVLAEHEREAVEELDIDTSAIELSDPGEIRPSESAEPPPPAPDTSHLSMGGLGEDIPHLERSETPLNPDTSHLQMGEAGETIPHLESEEEPLDPDTSGIELAPEGSDILEGQYRKRETAAPPNTDHLSLEP